MVSDVRKCHSPQVQAIYIHRIIYIYSRRPRRRLRRAPAVIRLDAAPPVVARSGTMATTAAVAAVAAGGYNLHFF